MARAARAKSTERRARGSFRPRARARPGQPTPHLEAWPKSSAYTCQEPCTSARRSTCPCGGITKERLRPVKGAKFLPASNARGEGNQRSWWRGKSRWFMTPPPSALRGKLGEELLKH